jgi:hypothetical protein
MSSDLIGRYLTLDLIQPIKWADFRLDALLALYKRAKEYDWRGYLIVLFALYR